MAAIRSTITLYPGSLEVERTLLVEHQFGNISNVFIEDDEGGTVEITGTFSLDQLDNLAEDLRIKEQA